MAEERTARPDRPDGGPLVHVRLAEHVERLRQEPTWLTSERNAITLTQQPGLRLVLMLLGRGKKIPAHHAVGSLTLQVLSGSVTFRAGDRAERIGPGELVVLAAALEHDVEAHEESAFLLTLGGAS